MVSRSSDTNRTRNVFVAGIVLGVLAVLLLKAVTPNNDSSADLQQINERLAGIERQLQTPTPAPASSDKPSGNVSISQINKSPTTFLDQTVEVTGKVSSKHEGVGFILVDQDGTFLWVHTKDKLPAATATVKGKVTQLKDQLAGWKNETGWPADDSALTAKLRDEKVFLEAESVS
jgi:hypothetical protein